MRCCVCVCAWHPSCGCAISLLSHANPVRVARSTLSASHHVVALALLALPEHHSSSPASFWGAVHTSSLLAALPKENPQLISTPHVSLPPPSSLSLPPISQETLRIYDPVRCPPFCQELHGLRCAVAELSLLRVNAPHPCTLARTIKHVRLAHILVSSPRALKSTFARVV
jgi:hypothetical protein